jgi:hypothetical protein
MRPQSSMADNKTRTCLGVESLQTRGFYTFFYKENNTTEFYLDGRAQQRKTIFSADHQISNHYHCETQRNGSLDQS